MKCPFCKKGNMEQSKSDPDFFICDFCYAPADREELESGRLENMVELEKEPEE